MDTLYPSEEGEERGEDKGNGGPPTAVKKVKALPAPSRKKSKGQSKVRRRTVNPKKMKKGKSGGGSRGEEDSLSEGEEEGVSRGVSRGGGVSGGGVGGGKGSDEEEESEGGGGEGEGGEEEEWNRLQQSMKKHSKKKFEQSALESPPVHAPYFPEVSQPVSRVCLCIVMHDVPMSMHCAGEAGGVVAVCGRQEEEGDDLFAGEGHRGDNSG